VRPTHSSGKNSNEGINCALRTSARTRLATTAATAAAAAVAERDAEAERRAAISDRAAIDTAVTTDRATTAQVMTGRATTSGLVTIDHAAATGSAMAAAGIGRTIERWIGAAASLDEMVHRRATSTDATTFGRGATNISETTGVWIEAWIKAAVITPGETNGRGTTGTDGTTERLVGAGAASEEMTGHGTMGTGETTERWTGVVAITPGETKRQGTTNTGGTTAAWTEVATTGGTTAAVAVAVATAVAAATDTDITAAAAAAATAIARARGHATADDSEFNGRAWLYASCCARLRAVVRPCYVPVLARWPCFGGLVLAHPPCRLDREAGSCSPRSWLLI
jgi:hypothetical protein